MVSRNKHLPLNALALALTSALSLPAHAVGVTTTYSLTSSLTSIQQLSLNVSYLEEPLTTLASGTHAFSFAGVTVIPTATGLYTLGQTSAPTDTVMMVYNGAFSAQHPTPPDAFNDDGALDNAARSIGSAAVVSCSSSRQCPTIVNYSMTAGTRYFLVISTWEAGDASLGLPLDFASFGPGTLQFFAIPAVGQFAPNSTVRSSSAAEVLDALNGGTGAMASAITALSALTPTQQQAALEKLTPVSSRALLLASHDGSASAFDRVSARLESLRVVDGAFTTPAFANAGGIKTGLSSGDEPKNSGVWLRTYGSEGKQGSKDGFAGYSSKGWGVAFGADRELATGLIAGLALNYSDTSLSFKDQLTGDNNGVTSTQLSVYGSKDYGRIYSEGMLAYSKKHYKSQRDTVVNGIASGEYDGDLWGVRLGGGMAFALSPSTTITPKIQVDWMQLKQYSYTETGGGALALNVAESTTKRLRASLGAQLNHDAIWGSLKLQPFARVFWHHDFQNDGIDSSASFTGGGATFLTPGQKLDEDTYSVGFGVNVFTAKNFTASVAYDGTFGNSYEQNTVQATARWAF